MMVEADYLAHAALADDWAAGTSDPREKAEWTQMAVEWRRLADMASRNSFWGPFIPNEDGSYPELLSLAP